MRGGRLRHRITVERQTGAAQDAYGGAVEDWTTLAARWAEIRPVNGREGFDADQPRGEVSHEIWLRYGADIADLSSADRITKGSRIFDIEAVRNIGERNRDLVVLAKERHV